MPNYDIIPLALDLLEYTIQRVKAKEAEYRQVKGYVMENCQLVERVLYEKVKDDGKPHFPKSQTFHLCARLEDCAADILEKCISADGRFFETEYEERMRSKLRRWERDYPTGQVTREEILQSWQAWDAHAAHGNTWLLRQQVRDRVQNILKEVI